MTKRTNRTQMPPPTICLNMIVKNESHIIATTLAHVLKHFPITFWVIDDTGSTDGTQQIIRDFFAARGISGELHETAWEDFGHNRSKALEHAFNKTDYVLVWDADDSVEGDFQFPKQLGADVYSFIFGSATGFRYNRNQLFNNRKRWKYVGVLHEYPECIDREETKGHVSGSYYFVSGKSGARSQDPDKYRKDAAVLERGLEKEPNNTRYAFYCANSYKDAGMNDKAIEKYKTVLEMNGWAEEKYLACVHIYELSGKVRENLHYLVEAISYSPDRLEAPFELIQHYCVRNMNKIAMAYYSLVQDYYENRFATDDVSRFLFVKKEIGDFHLPYIMIIVALKVGNPALAIKMADMMFTQRYDFASEWHMKNAFFNLQFAVEKLEPSLQFLQKLLRYRYQLGYILDDDANKSIEKIIDKHRDLLAAPIKWKHEPRCTDEVKIFFSITTCKRYDLFERTMNSLLRTWRDKEKIDYFFCVDDNSSKADREKMRKKYPFFKYHMKGPNEKGHRQSMNIIWSKLKELKPKYWIHMEDDWLFFYEDDYVSRATAFLDNHEMTGIHQLLFNRNYAELYEWDIVGGSKIEPGFLLHERSGIIPVGRRTNAYWPHYSFRPSMIRVAPILDLGNYDSPNTFFERDYADRYATRGYKSAFFDAITCFHTGKLTTDKTGTNAYSLNNENQFADTIATHVINLERRPDRRIQVCTQMENHKQTNYSFFKAIDAQQLKPTSELVRLFKGNDFNNRRTFIACAMSHYRLWQRLVSEKSHSAYLIFEDDITLHTDYVDQYKKVIDYIKDNKEVDFLFLGYHSRDPYARDISGGFVSLAMDKYIGGFFSYIITRTGAEKILKFIAEKGIKHGIDYLVKIVPNLKCISLQPHIVYSEWVQTLSSPIDSDIQKDFINLPLDFAADRWIFYPRLDHIGDDIQHIGRKSTEELNIVAEENTSCIAYNTLGFLKNNVNFPLSHSPWFGDNDGIYVRRSAIKRIKMLCNWCDSSTLINEYGRYLAKQSYDLTTDDTDIDYWIIINYPQTGTSYDPKRSLVFRVEPWCGESWQTWGGKTWGEWAKPDPTKFLYVHDLSAACTPAFWQMNARCRDLMNESPILNKTADIACILSEKVFDPGHKHRLALLRLAEAKGGLPFKIFGRENYHNLSFYTGPTTGPKENYIRPYKYYFMCENNAEPGYITEKLWEPILCESLCFYWGAPNVADYVDPRAYVQLDMTDYEAAYETIKKAVAEDWWSQRIPYIREAKQKVLRELNLFSIVEKVIASK